MRVTSSAAGASRSTAPTGTAQMITREGRLAVETISGVIEVESGEVLFER